MIFNTPLPYALRMMRERLNSRTALVRAAVVIVLVGAIICIGARSSCQEMKHVLVLHSYHKGLTWTDSEDSGIRSALQKRSADVEAHTEYLDTKTLSDEEHYRMLFELFRHKYASIAIDAVIATDDDAYNFYLKHLEALFSRAPVVFCGVNYYEDSQREGREDLVTGVVEAFDIPATLRAALQLYPRTSRIIIINDRTTTGLANKKIINEKVVPLFSEKVRFEFFEDLTMDELLEKVGSLSSDDIILLMTFNKDRAGRVFNYDQSITLIAGKAVSPIFGVWDFYLDKGIVGGMLTSGIDQGRTAAEIALRILDGEKVRNIPVVKESPNRFKFDYRQMQRFGIGISDLPPGSMIINQPVSFYSQHKGLVWGGGSGFLALSLMIVLLLVIISQRRHGEIALRVSEEKYRSLVDNINLGVFRSSPGPSGRFLQVNPAMIKIYGYDSLDDFLKISVSDLYQTPEERILFVDEMGRNGFVQNKELAMRKKDGTPIWISVNAKPQYDDNGVIKWIDGVNEDITERKRAEDALQNAYDKLEQKVLERTKELSVANEQLHQRHLETSVLYQVSSVISRSITMDKLLTEVLNTISSMEVFKIDKGEIFIIEGDSMKIIANVGHSDHFLKLHNDMRVGDCLCGTVAQTGEILISTNSAKDGRRTIVDCNAAGRGRIIVPLKTKDRVEGVMGLYMPVEGTMDENKVKLLLSIANQLGIAIENAKLYEKTKAISLHDSLTGLWNHEEILRILGLELARAEREGSAVSVIMADLDNFKLVNDTYGHFAGDVVLREAARRMLSLFRSYDAIGRYGGEEFMIVMPGCDGQSAAEIAERLRNTIGDESMDTPAGMVSVTISLGVAISSMEKSRDVNSYLQAADLALYRAKTNGRNRVEFASGDE